MDWQGCLQDFGADGRIPTSVLRNDMQRTMQATTAAFRTHESLSDGSEELADIEIRFLTDVKVSDKRLVWNTDLIETLELRNLITNARQMNEAALRRMENRGAGAGDDENSMEGSLTWHHGLGEEIRTGTREM
jgi:succinate dehydrogenase (ubiquinone) flavoprotein subunit